MITKGNNNINAISLGNTPMSAVFKGHNQIWPNDYTLIGGVKWANTNLIADPNDATGMTSVFAETADSYGDLYQWGRKKAWQYEGNFSNWDATSEPGTDYITLWPLENDPSPDGWRIPTLGELILLFNAGSTWVEMDAKGNAVAGRFFGVNSATATMDNMQGCIFLPAAGCINGDERHISLDRGQRGIYRCNIYNNPIALFTNENAAPNYYYNAAKNIYAFSMRCVKI